MTKHYNPHLDTLWIEEISNCRADTYNRIEKPGVSISYCKDTGEVRTILIKNAAYRLGNDIDELNVRETAETAADWLETMWDVDATMRLASKSLKPVFKSCPGTLERCVEELVAGALLYKDLSPADTAREIMSWPVVQQARAINGAAQ